MKHPGFLHPGRALAASLALVANLIAAGVPVLHAWAHTGDHGHAVAVDVHGAVDHRHGEAHPPSLHDDCVVAHRDAWDSVAPHAATTCELVSVTGTAAAAIHPVPPVSSRAPPSPVQPRAPPLA